MLKHHFYFSFILGCLVLSCQTFYKNDEAVCFKVVDVGQGLGQLIKLDRDALVMDIGPAESYKNWFSAYQNSGKPYILAIVVSHRDLDHSGGLQFLDSTVNWSGVIVTTPFEDTSYIKNLCRRWTGVLSIIQVCSGDTIGGLEGVEVKCVWPPTSISEQIPVQQASINRYSLVFLVKFQRTQILISSDIDSFAASDIALSYKNMLKSDILVFPHHGSAGSLNRVFLGYVDPACVVISCGYNNDYNHPAPSVVSFLNTMGVEIKITYLTKTINFISNGYYWSCSPASVF